MQWKNLIPVQDTAKARTVEEFKTKQFRYQLTEYAVEIERMTIALENLSVKALPGTRLYRADQGSRWPAAVDGGRGAENGRVLVAQAEC